MSILSGFSKIATSLMIVAALSLSGCSGGKRIRKANVDEIAEGMSKKQVESILGPPTSVDSKDFVVMKKTTYLYQQGKDTVTIVFKDDKVQTKDSTLSQ
jgi:outer membrane protein assembly factor BamE (lipoprotein component of BamABCDE complex)